MQVGLCYREYTEGSISVFVVVCLCVLSHACLLFFCLCLSLKTGIMCILSSMSFFLFFECFDVDVCECVSVNVRL
jgi:hypothetical protein